MRALLFAVAAVLALGETALAQPATDPNCDAFAWPVKTELNWMAAPDPLPLETGATVAAIPAKAIAVTLKPTAEVTLAVRPSGAPKVVAEQTFAGLFVFDRVPKPGLYQVSLSVRGWIDVIQNAQPLKDVAHTGMKDCEPLHKSVRFEIGDGPITLQLSSMPDAHARVVIREAE